MNASQAEYTAIKSVFSRLNGISFALTSPRDKTYNCIAWAAGDTTQWWWPIGKAYWPDGVKADRSVEAFQECFLTLGFSPCSNSDFEEGFEKVALYLNSDGKVTHAARQLPDELGLWTSKLGKQWDIAHPLDGVGGDGPEEYGRVAVILRRPV